MRIVQIVSAVLFLLLLSGCSPDAPKVQSVKKVTQTKYPSGSSPLQKYLHRTDKTLGSRSAFYSLNLPADAFAARLFLVDKAVSSLDVQYYIYDDDLIGNVFSAHLLLAAERGVRVRILLDDLSTSGKDKKLQQLALHPNIKLRLFNPNRLRTSFRNLALLLNINSLGKRMHNKSLIADGTAAIIGGRNIGDVYFAATDETLFLDYDVLSIGFVVPEISKAFDIYWNSEEAEPAAEIVGGYDGDYGQFEKVLKVSLKQEAEKFEKRRLGQAVKHSDFMKKVNSKRLLFTVADRTDFYYDPPHKVRSDENNDTDHISQQIAKDLKHVDRDIMIISPYFIPSDEMVSNMRNLRERNVSVTIVTNSLASTDVPPVYAGYQEYIRPLLEIGVKIYELKPNALPKKIRKKGFKKVPSLSLHTKMMLLDHKRLAIGSANIDPRSDKLNTELFMVISSEALTKTERTLIKRVLTLDHLYELMLVPYALQLNTSNPKKGLIWRTKEEGRLKIYKSRPKTGFIKGLGTDLMSLLPIKGYL